MNYMVSIMPNNKKDSPKKAESPISKSEILTTIIPLAIAALSLLANWLFNYVNWWAVLINGAIVLVGMLIITLINHRIKIKSINTELEDLSKATIELKEAAQLEDVSKKLMDILRKITTSTDLLKYVADGEKLLKIEGSVGDCGVTAPKIYVQSSKFELETSNSIFAKMLLENLRKGVQYRYLIPNYKINPEEYDRFEDMILSWWNDYASFLYDKDICDKLVSQGINPCWNNEYKRYVSTASNYWKNTTSLKKWKQLAQELHKLFLERIVVYTAEESRFYIVTAIYQVGNNLWKAIVKLPTEYLDDDINDYYSFVVFGEEEESSDNSFIKKFRANFVEESMYSMERINNRINSSIERLIDENH